ncbi:type II toxin-antitoxin system RelE/ParE family toxin [Streptococcus danieliae]|uniref:Type II toxin-antitoxin system RelE/ParE family toxin n=1 Tax=Streptococcus danieliae TaxID=747656 RepID=A0A7Z0RQT5_9STRE|nr:type II toxin-antitoxin system RelE/ParE family toxin [Streptococcus danieliae]MBF0716558.1 type II toxin-antitoxin system RelE/ParE family toxin [Streptococcus danieliae]NYS48488.1 type II toxin-antitoxin system RelE/ParE family toxin [Streptococcus danieliae]
MQIHYNNKNVEKQCTDLRRAKKDFSVKIALKLHKLIQFIESADNLASVVAFPTYHFHDLKGSRTGQYALDIDGRRSSYRLLVCFEEDKETVFSSAQTIKIIQVEEVSNHYGL